MNVQKGDCEVAHLHKLIKTEYKNHTIQTPVGPPMRFPKVSDKELDELAQKRIAEATKWQTKWAVNVFHGKYNFSVRFY